MLEIQTTKKIQRRRRRRRRREEGTLPTIEIKQRYLWNLIIV